MQYADIKRRFGPNYKDKVSISLPRISKKFVFWNRQPCNWNSEQRMCYSLYSERERLYYAKNSYALRNVFLSMCFIFCIIPRVSVEN